MSSKKSGGDEAAKSSSTEGGDAGAAEVQKKTDEAEEQGFIGTKADPRPNTDYTLSGVTGDNPPQTHETEADKKGNGEAKG